MRKIAEFMTPCPLTLDGDEPIEHAAQFMVLRGIRHLPIVRNGELVGVLFDHEARLFEVLAQVTSFKANAGDVCNKEPQIVSSESRVSAVAHEMAERHLDYVLVVDASESIVGIFTTNDACRYIHYMTSGV